MIIFLFLELDISVLIFLDAFRHDYSIARRQERDFMSAERLPLISKLLIYLMPAIAARSRHDTGLTSRAYFAASYLRLFITFARFPRL